MPKVYKNAFEIPTGQDPADIPKIFEKFIDSGIIRGAVIAHFDDLKIANTEAQNGHFPDGSFAWIRAVLYRSNGVFFTPVPMASSGYAISFVDESSRDSFYVVGGTHPPVEGQLASVGVYPNVKLTMYEGNGIWTDHTDLMIRNHNLEGDHTGNTVSVGDPNNPYKMGGIGYRKLAGWAVNLAGHTFVDGDFHISNGNFNIVRGAHTINGTSFTVSCPVTAKSSLEGVGGVYGPAVYADRVLPRNGDNGTRLDYYGVGVFNNGVFFTQNIAVHTGIVITAGSLQISAGGATGYDVTGANSFVRGNLWVTGTTVTSGLQYSDRRLKSDISTAPSGALGLVKQIPVQSFTLQGRKSTFGWIAQDVVDALPTAVTELSNEFEDDSAPALKAANGSHLKTIMGLDVNEMTATLWKAVQELSSEVENLRAQIDSLT